MQIRITRPWAVVLSVVIVAVAAWVLIDWLVVTERERVRMTIDGIEVAVEKNDVDACMPYLDETFRLGGMDPERFRAWYADILGTVRVRRASQYKTTVKIDPDDPTRARAEVLSFIEVESPAGTHRIDWELLFLRRGEHEWKLIGARAFWPRDGSEIPLSGIRNWIP